MSHEAATMGNVFVVSRKRREGEILPVCASRLLSLSEEEIDRVKEAKNEMEQDGMSKKG